MWGGKSPTANPGDSLALLDVSLCTPARKECSCLPVPHSCRLCHAQGDIHIYLARQILELPPCHTPGLPDRVKNIPQCQGWRSDILHHLRFLFTSDKPTLSSLPEQVFGVCSFGDCSPQSKGSLPPPSSLHHINPEFQSRSERPRLWTFPG